MVKRSFDLLVAGIGLLFAAPALLVISAIIKITSPGPICYRGERVGRHGKPFRIFKFRSMVVNADKIGGSSTSDRDPRITRIGLFLRKFKLDELPQIFNVLSGQMSLIGPRPEVQQYVDMYTDEEQQILELRPGITDWASIWNSDEGALLAGAEDPDKAYEEIIRPTKLRLQLEYARTHTLWVDIKIVCFTAYKMLNRNFMPREVEAILKVTGGPDPRTYRIDTAHVAADGQQEFSSVTELPGHGATREQFSMMQTRYRFAAELAKGKDLLELACGPGVGLGYLGQKARRVVGGDLDRKLVQAAAQHYGARLEVQQIDAQQLPFADESFDVILLLEAIYYLPNPEKFVADAKRVLRPGGSVFVCSANRERPDFNPSPYTHRYFSANELRELLVSEGFDVDIYGAYPVASGGSKLIGTLRKLAVSLRLIPKSMKWKVRLKRLVFGKLDPIPAELEVSDANCEELIPIHEAKPVTDYKVIYAVGRRAA